MNDAAKALANHIDRDSASFAKAMCFGEIAANIECPRCHWHLRKDFGPSHFLFCENVRCPQYEVLYQGALTTPLTPAVPSKAALFFTSKGAHRNHALEIATSQKRYADLRKGLIQYTG